MIKSVYKCSFLNPEKNISSVCYHITMEYIICYVCETNVIGGGRVVGFFLKYDSQKLKLNNSVYKIFYGANHSTFY